MQAGTRPYSANRTARWNNKEIANLHGVGHGVRMVDYWKSGERLPADIAPFLEAFFADDPQHAETRSQFLKAYDEARDIAPSPAMFVGVPRSTPHFVGREGDVAAVVDAILTLPSPVAILVQGGPGIGKTELTKAVAHHLKIIQRFSEANRWFAPLETATTAEAMRDAVVRALGGDPAAGFAAALAALAGRQGLLILDNLETPWEPFAERAEVEETLAVLAELPGLAILASFRGRERVSGPAWAVVHPVPELKAAAAAELFCRIAARSLSADPCLARFIGALGGVPLAIELVAHLAYGDTPLAELWARWEKVGADLAAHPDAAHPEFKADRLSSLPHSIELSLRSGRMTPLALRLFRLLGALPAGIANDDRDDLLGEDGFDADGRLRRIGLAIEGDSRIDLLPPIRDYALRHYPIEELDGAYWPSHYIALTQRLGEVIGSAAGDGAVARLQTEFANIEAAFRAMIASGCRAMGALQGFARLTYLASIPTQVFRELATSCGEEGDVLGEANCISALGDIALRRSDQAGARSAYEEALLLYRRVGSGLGEANCIKGLGNIALRGSDQAGARSAYEEALPLYRRVGDMHGEANCILSLGKIALARSDQAGARSACEEALALYRRVGDVLGEANCISALGDIALRRSDQAGARSAYEEALLLYRRVGNVNGEANCISALGDIALRRSDQAGARSAYEQALPLYRQVGDVLGEATCLANLKQLGDGA
jgi:tetratricopeptide (TPR) repeat protein